MHTMLLPPLLLVVVALGQVTLAKTVGLTAWKGGGFGMFSTLDHGAYRGVVATIEAMKMEANITTPVGGTVERLAIGGHQQVEGGDLILVIAQA